MMESNIEVQGMNLGIGLCLECIGIYKMHVNSPENIANEVTPPPINFAVTHAPSWQQQQIRTVEGIQTVTVCIPLPSCMVHLGVKEQTPQQRAAQSGLIIPGGV